MRKILKSIIILLALMAYYAIATSAYDTVIIRKEIRDFVAKGVLNETKSTDEIKYYDVPRETWMIDKPAFTTIGGRTTAGSMGDLFVTTESPFPDLPFIHQFISFFFGGHAATVGKYAELEDGRTLNENRVLEVLGNNPDPDLGWRIIQSFLPNFGPELPPTTNVVDFQVNYWFTPESTRVYRREFIGLRVKGATIEDYDAVTDYMIDALGQPYSYAFVVDRIGGYYCTDLMSIAWSRITPHNDDIEAFNLNKDGFITSVNDLVRSPDTYLFFYKSTDAQGVKHIYTIAEGD